MICGARLILVSALLMSAVPLCAGCKATDAGEPRVYSLGTTSKGCTYAYIEEHDRLKQENVHLKAQLKFCQEYGCL